MHKLYEGGTSGLARELTARGYRVHEAADGRSALRRWDARRPDVILLDLGLPDIEGIEVIKRVRTKLDVWSALGESTLRY